VGKQSNRTLIGYLPLVFATTFLVVVAPMLLVFYLRKSGVVTSVWTGTLVAVAASLLASHAGGAFWKTRTDSRDILFSDLMPWGWIQRWRAERRLTAAADLLGLTTGRPHAIADGRLTDEQKAGLLTQLTSSLEARDPYTHGHSRRVARHASNIATRMGLARDEVAKIRAAGAMHDVGKVETPIAVLHKEGKLTDQEYAVIKRHPVDGAEMVSTLRDDELTAMVRHHHERLDGEGYPDGLAGDAIPIGARILAVADTFDAITSTRPYRHAHAHKKALDILAADAGTQLDPDAVRAFCSCYSGRRPLTYWTLLANARPRLLSWFGAGLAPAKAATMGTVMATAATVAAVGGAAVGPVADADVAPSSPSTRAETPARTATATRQLAFRQTRPQGPGGQVPQREGKEGTAKRRRESARRYTIQGHALEQRLAAPCRPASEHRPRAEQRPTTGGRCASERRPAPAGQPSRPSSPAPRDTARTRSRIEVGGRVPRARVEVSPDEKPGKGNGRAPGKPAPNPGGPRSTSRNP